MTPTARSLFLRGRQLLGMALTVGAGAVSAHANGAVQAVFTVQAAGEHAIVRALTTAPVCPGISWNGDHARAMAVRAQPGQTPARSASASAQPDSKPSVFDTLTCEAVWPRRATRARVAGYVVPAPHRRIERIVIVADTGCRMKSADNAFQPCNDPQQWPFAQVARSAAATRPDLVVHIGDMHYRESPCPAGNAGCASSVWGYGSDAWQADFFTPAKPLLAAAPWVFVRGNHESCARAGQGWFRFFDADPWTPARSCNDPAHDHEADFSAPYAVPITPTHQLIVFDSSRTSGQPYSSGDAAFGTYAAQLGAVDTLSQRMPHNFFLSHHPLLAVAHGDAASPARPGGSQGVQSAFASVAPARLFPEKIDITMHGHIHLFESLSFESPHPASLVLGNSGSANDGHVKQTLPPGFEAYPGAVVQDYAARSDYGFVTLDKVGARADQWRLTEYSVNGAPVLRCHVEGGKSRCAPVL